MNIDNAKVDQWYGAISAFLESKAGSEDVIAPGSLVTALCRVLVDATEQVDASDRKKLDAIVQLTAHFMGFEDAILLLGKDAESIS